MSKQRIYEMDILRGIAFLSIVLQHSIGEYFYRAGIQPEDTYLIGMIYNFSKFGVPIFVFITGMALFYNYNQQLKYGTFMKKRVSDILVPFILWNFIYIMYVFSTFNLFALDWATLYKEFITPKIGYHLWYIIMIFQFYLLYPLFLKMVKWIDTTRNKRRISLITLFILYVIYLWLSYHYLPLHISEYPLWLQQILNERNIFFISYIFYFIFGGFAALHLNKFRDWVTKSTSWNSFLFFALLIWVTYELFAGLKSFHSLDFSNTLKPTVFLFVMSEILILYLLAMLIAQYKTYVNKILTFIGTYSFGAYLIHALVLSVSIRLLNKVNIPFIEYHYSEVTILMFIFVSIVSVVSTYILSKIPFGYLLAGTKKKKKK